MITSDPKKSITLKNIFLQASDVFLTISALPYGSQFSHFSGVCSFEKTASLSKFQQFGLKNVSYGIKISKKTLDIEPLYETPQDVSNEEGSQGKGKEKEKVTAKNIDF